MATYTHGHHESVLRSHTWRTVDNSAAYLVPHLRAGLDVLDVGCGPGTITDDLAARVAPGRVIGVDAVAGVMTGARNRAAADVYALPFDDGTFDVVHAHQVLQHVADPVAALREMARVCRDDTGVVAARDSDYAAFAWYPLLPQLDDWLQLYRHAARANGGEPDAGRRLNAWARSAGFLDVEATSSTWCFANAEERAWWGTLWADRMTESAIARQIVDSGLASSEQLAVIAAGWREWADHDDAWFSVLHGEILCRI
ncbi:MAG TPA: methyltransferase domain-containing protein [Acidimicrobiales bacterium]|nr:methyltransferase domain-containing protein [Acidimicrobiales bacterium]